MIATVLVLIIGAIIGVGKLILSAMFLAHVQSVDSPPDWRSFRPNDSSGTDFPNTPQEAQEPPYPR